ncbi:MAG: HesB/IscA family protein [Deltaproteobacteria bacterium]
MITLTPTAAKLVASLLSEEGARGWGLRIQVVGGGCEGLYYDVQVAKAAGPEDDELTSEGVRLFVDRRARPLLDGARLDYRDGFRFENPNARRSCRCGVSFR